jgi:hypothetical protein
VENKGLSRAFRAESAPRGRLAETMIRLVTDWSYHVPRLFRAVTFPRGNCDLNAAFDAVFIPLPSSFPDARSSPRDFYAEKQCLFVRGESCPKACPDATPPSSIPFRFGSFTLERPLRNEKTNK